MWSHGHQLLLEMMALKTSSAHSSQSLLLGINSDFPLRAYMSTQYLFSTSSFFSESLYWWEGQCAHPKNCIFWPLLLVGITNMSRIYCVTSGTRKGFFCCSLILSSYLKCINDYGSQITILWTCDESENGTYTLSTEKQKDVRTWALITLWSHHSSSC